jgi:hypothetical protein
MRYKLVKLAQYSCIIAAAAAIIIIIIMPKH